MSLSSLIARSALTALGLLALAPAAGWGATEQGVYEACKPGDTSATLDACTQRLERIRGAGFGVVLNYASWDSNEANLTRYAAAAQRLGLELIWPLNGAYWRDADENLVRRYPSLAASCTCDDDASFTTYAAGLASSQPATWGWYVGDEVPAGDRDDVATLSRRIRQVDPGHPQLLVSYETGATQGANLAPFAGLTEYAGADIYPVGSGQPLDSVGAVARGVRRLAESTGSRVALVLQAFSLAAYPTLGRPNAPWPTATEMRTMRDEALAGGRPDLLLWYSAYDVLDKAPDPDGQLARLAWAATAPPTTALEPPVVRGRAISASFSTDAAGSAECRLDSQGWVSCESPFRAGDLRVGTHVLDVRATDLLAQTGRAGTTRFSVAPVVISNLRAPRRIVARPYRLRERRSLTARCRRSRICHVASARLHPPSVSFSLTRSDRVALTFRRRSRLVSLPLDAASGRSRVTLPARVERRLTRGRWRLEASAEGAERRSRVLRVGRAESRR